MLGGYEKDCCNPMLAISTQNRKVLASLERAFFFFWKTLYSSIHPCLKERDPNWGKHTDALLTQYSCHGELS